MTIPELEPSPPPPSRPFQFRLRTLLLLFVVLGSSLAVFGVWGVVVFGFVVGLAIYLYQTDSSLSLAAFRLGCNLRDRRIVWLFLPFIFVAREAARRPACAITCPRSGGAASLSPGIRLLPTGIHRGQEWQADAQLADVHSALYGLPLNANGLRFQRTLGWPEEQTSGCHEPAVFYLP